VEDAPFKTARRDDEERVNPRDRSRLGLCAALVLALALLALLASRPPPPAGSATRAALWGYRHAWSLDEGDAEDAGLVREEERAGRRWALGHRPRVFDDCPSFSAPFQRGCAGALRER